MNIYWLVVFAVILFGMIIPQEGYYRKYYVGLMAVIHIFVCGFRYEFLVGDLIRYNTTFRHYLTLSYFDEEVIDEWRNTGFSWLMKFVGNISNGNYQVFLFVLALITGVITAVVIYKYSPKPWISYLVWNCMAFYVTYDFMAIKQGTAMAIIMLSLICIFEKKPIGFLCLTLLAGFIHMPALIFLPAYFIANRKVNINLIAIYIVGALLIFSLRTQIVDMASEVYYEEDSFVLNEGGIGGRTLVIILILVVGLLLKGFREKQFNQLFNIIVVAAILQMFSAFDNVFTRLTDYYLQFVILFIPLIFYDSTKSDNTASAAPAVLQFNERSIKLLVICLVVVLIWWYHTTCLGVPIESEMDNFLNYRFMWQ